MFSCFVRNFTKVFLIKIEDLSIHFFHDENVFRYIAKKKGNPFDNTNTIYLGFPNDLEVNRKVERLAAKVDNNAYVGKYNRTINITKPTLILHIIYDQLISNQYTENNIENMILKQVKAQYFTVKYSNI